MTFLFHKHLCLQWWALLLCTQIIFTPVLYRKKISSYIQCFRFYTNTRKVIILTCSILAVPGQLPRPGPTPAHLSPRHQPPWGKEIFGPVRPVKTLGRSCQYGNPPSPHTAGISLSLLSVVWRYQCRDQEWRNTEISVILNRPDQLKWMRRKFPSYRVQKNRCSSFPAE